MLAPAGRQTYHRPYVYTCRRVHRPSVATLARDPGADCAPRRARAALPDRDAGAHLVRHDARPAGGLRPRRGRRRRGRLGRDLVQLPGLRRRAPRAPARDRARAARRRPRFASPAAAFDALSRATAVLAIQSGEHGPLAQAIAGLDLALWDLCARRRRRAALAPARRQRRPRRGLCERHQPGPARGRRRRPAQRRLPRVQAEGRLRRRARPGQRRARCGRCSAPTRR